MKYDNQLGAYTLFGDPFTKRIKIIEPSSVFSTILEGYSLVLASSITLNVRSMAWLEKEKEKVRNSTQFNTYLSGGIYIATRDRR